MRGGGREAKPAASPDVETPGWNGESPLKRAACDLSVRSGNRRREASIAVARSLSTSLVFARRFPSPTLFVGEGGEP